MDLIKKKDGFRNERHVIFSSEINQKIKDHPLIEGNYISEVGYYPSAKYHYRERVNGTSEYILIYCLDGAGNIEVDNKKQIRLRRGEIFCIPPTFSPSLLFRIRGTLVHSLDALPFKSRRNLGIECTKDDHHQKYPALFDVTKPFC